VLCMPLNVPSMCLTHTRDQRFTDFNCNTPSNYSLCVIPYGCLCFLCNRVPPLLSTGHYLCPIQFSISWTCVMAYSKLKLKSTQKKHLSVSDYMQISFYVISFWHDFTLTQLENLHHFSNYAIILGLMQSGIEEL